MKAVVKVSEEKEERLERKKEVSLFLEEIVEDIVAADRAAVNTINEANVVRIASVIDKANKIKCQ